MDIGSYVLSSFFSTGFRGFRKYRYRYVFIPKNLILKPEPLLSPNPEYPILKYTLSPYPLRQAVGMRALRVLLVLCAGLVKHIVAQRLVKSGTHADVTTLADPAEFAAFVADHEYSVIAFTTGDKAICNQQGQVCQVLQAGFYKVWHYMNNHNEKYGQDIVLATVNTDLVSSVDLEQMCDKACDRHVPTVKIYRRGNQHAPVDYLGLAAASSSTPGDEAPSRLFE